MIVIVCQRPVHNHGGIRAGEIGTQAPAAMDLVRLRMPRRTYPQSKIDDMGEVFAGQAEMKHDRLRFYNTDQPPWMRHSTSKLEQWATSPAHPPF